MAAVAIVWVMFRAPPPRVTVPVGTLGALAELARPQMHTQDGDGKSMVGGGKLVGGGRLETVGEGWQGARGVAGGEGGGQGGPN